MDNIPSQALFYPKITLKLTIPSDELVFQANQALRQSGFVLKPGSFDLFFKMCRLKRACLK
jgi:hypothetical protein